jgi:serine/threonine-protein phosphatase 4 regulatory subunit 1
MSPNVIVSETARYAVVNILKRIRRANERDQIEEDMDEQGDEWDSLLAMGLFGPQERRLFEQEMLQQVVIGIGRLDERMWNIQRNKRVWKTCS